MTDHRVSLEERDGSNQSAGLYFLIPKAVRGVVKRLLNAPMNSPHDHTASRSGSRAVRPTPLSERPSRAYTPASVQRPRMRGWQGGRVRRSTIPPGPLLARPAMTKWSDRSRFTDSIEGPIQRETPSEPPTLLSMDGVARMQIGRVAKGSQMVVSSPQLSSEHASRVA
jgi:hypothetical protein